MRIFRQRALVAPFVGVGVVLFGLSACVVEEKKRNNDDDCDTDSDCDDDEVCDDGECERRASGSGGTNSGSAGTGGTSVGTAGSGPSGGSANSSTDTQWCTDGCEAVSICPEAQPVPTCISGCLASLDDARSLGCGAQYQALNNCILTTESCDEDVVYTLCDAEVNALIACVPSAPSG